MKRNEIENTVKNFYNQLSIKDTEILLWGLENGYIKGEYMTLEQFIKYTVDCYEGGDDSLVQLCEKLKSDTKDDLEEISVIREFRAKDVYSEQNILEEIEF